MFSRPSGLASRIAFTALLLIVSTYLLYNRHLLQTSTVRFDSLLDDLHGYTDKHLEYFFQDGTTDENGFHARILRFWVELQEILGEVRPDIRPIKPMEAHIEQSFEENWPDLVHEQKISLPSRDVKKLKESHAAMLTHIEQLASTLPYRKKTRGVVTTAGAKYINPLLISLRMLRRAGSQLPVEVFFDTRTSQTNRICAKILPKLQAECVFFSDIWAATADTVEPMQMLKSYQLKVFALLFSSFEEVLFFDADAFPARNPDHMLRVDPFIALGLVTWPDFWSITSSPTFWQIAGVDVGVAKKESDARASTESGVMLVSKEKHARTLLLAAYYNYYGPECYYPLLSQGAQGEGDKETFVHAALALGEPFYAVHSAVQVLGDFFDGKWQTAGMKQADPLEDFRRNGDVTINATASPMFVHHNIMKLDPEKLFENSLFSENSEGRRRLWGGREDAELVFESDLERRMWEEVTAVACGISSTLCKKAEKRLKTVYAE